MRRGARRAATAVSHRHRCATVVVSGEARGRVAHTAYNDLPPSFTEGGFLHWYEQWLAEVAEAPLLG